MSLQVPKFFLKWDMGASELAFTVQYSAVQRYPNEC